MMLKIINTYMEVYVSNFKHQTLRQISEKDIWSTEKIKTFKKQNYILLKDILGKTIDWSLLIYENVFPVELKKWGTNIVKTIPVHYILW